MLRDQAHHDGVHYLEPEAQVENALGLLYSRDDPGEACRESESKDRDDAVMSGPHDSEICDIGGKPPDPLVHHQNEEPRAHEDESGYANPLAGSGEYVGRKRGAAG